MLVYSHRGNCAGRPQKPPKDTSPENSFEAFERAWEAGVDGIETDVRRTADGRLVLFHDGSLSDDRSVADVTHEELNADIGFEVPTLEATLDRWPEAAWMLEIKVPEALPGTIAAIGKSRRSPQLMLTSFWHSVVAQAAGELSVELGVLVSHRPASLESRAAAGFPDAANIRTVVWYHEFLDTPAVEQARALGLRSFVYGPQTPADHRRCVELGVDGVITDDVGRVADGSRVASCGLRVKRSRGILPSR